MILMATDLHLTDDPRHEYRFKFLSDFTEYIKSDSSIKAVFILGDLCDKKDKHVSRLVNRVVEYLVGIAKLVPLWVLKGNHDQLDGNPPYWEFLGKLDNVNYIIEPSKYTVLGKSFLFLPHSRNTQEDWKNIKEFLPVDYVMMHQTVKGVKISNGMELDGVDVSIFGNTEIVSGDIHTQQDIGNVHYIGSPYQIHYGDGYKGHFGIIDETGLSLCEYNAPNLSVIELTKDMDFSKVLEGHKGDFARIRLSVPMASMSEWHETKGKILSMCEDNSIFIDSIDMILQNTDLPEVHSEVMRDVKRTTSVDPESVFDEYSKINNIDNKKLIDVGRSILTDQK